MTRLDALANAIAADFELCSDERDVFCGHGLGGLLAFEVARRLRRDGTDGPRGLAVCGTPAADATCSHESLHQLGPREFIAGVERRYGGIPREIRAHAELLELFLPVVRADIEAVETYRFDPSYQPLDIPILAIAGTNDPLVRSAELAGWQRHTTSWFSSAQVSGGHFILTENPCDSANRVRRFLSAL